MEDKLAKWVFVVAGSSYAVFVSLFLVFILITKDGAFQDPTLVKALLLLVVYIFSLWLTHFSNGKDNLSKLKIWLCSLAMHIGIMSYVVYIFESSAAFVVMLPEICILVLMLVGIFIIWGKVRDSKI